MNILMMNYRYFLSAGPERYMFATEDLLKVHGHNVVPFALDYSQNRATPYSRHFPSPPVGKDVVFYKDMRFTFLRKLKMVGMSIYNFEAKRKLKDAMRAEDIDLVYALQIVNLLAPSVIDACYEMGIPFVLRLSNFQMVCPSYNLFRNGRICEECVTGKYYKGVIHRCMKNSVSISFARVLSMYLSKLRGVNNKISHYISPSKIVRQKMIEGGFDPEKVTQVMTFTECAESKPQFKPGDYILYVGQIEPVKGLRVLLEAYAGMRTHRSKKLLIAGYSLGDEEQQIKNMVRDRGISGVEFLGFVKGETLSDLFRNARCVVQPCLWYENVPNVALEAMGYGKPIVASRLGGMSEIISDGQDGLLFESGNARELGRKLTRLLEDDSLAEEMGRAARKKIEEEFGAERHYRKLMAVFNSVIDTNARKPVRKLSGGADQLERL
jgi:glycosyltransferase involved in cell wall biosynthesis